jgi:hypothetical protein
MRLTKALLASAVAATLASQAVAGGFAPVVVAPSPWLSWSRKPPVRPSASCSRSRWPAA